MAPAPRLSVLLPTYNGSHFLDCALSSVEQQGMGTDVQVIAVDDGSTDDTLAVLRRWEGRVPLKIYAGSHKGNWVANTNVALAHAQGEWVSWLHQDDCWLPHRLATLFSLVESQPEVSLVLHPAEFWDDHNRRLGCWRCPFPAGQALGPQDILPRLILQNTVPIVSPMVRRSLLMDIGPMDEDLWYFADWDYWLKLAAAGKWHYHDVPLGVFRLHAGSQTMQRTGALEEVGRQFDVVTERAAQGADFPLAEEETRQRQIRFARAMYLLMLGGFHRRSGTVSDCVRAAWRLGPRGIWQYARAARLLDRVLPRVRLLGRWR